MTNLSDRKSIAAIVEENRDVFETIATAEELPEDFRERYGRRPLRYLEGGYE
ncbi:hypothetical protein EFA46_015900 (plasmid) [Halarchaeum sp. CBA1220]|uniref:hypothetical protein n=1 Tax=Halarchaeum sp. CBA1220 TaxID=1853682 RepID=UPI001314A706|nr:hypothetical protein [Halarchaeum sp. CBA1220]QLC35741.1 hypothetical protein EFA46_015900 [Halarchaeum sp. CBA1220]